MPLWECLNRLIKYITQEGMSSKKFAPLEGRCALRFCHSSACYNDFMYLVSACLAGFNTRYDGTNAKDERILSLVAQGRAIAVCPEQLGGLPTPRPAVEFRGGGSGPELLEGGSIRLEDADGRDYTDSLLRGAREVLRMAVMLGIKEAVLRDGSPSCGVTYAHADGSRVAGRGVCAELLERNGIRVRTVDSL
jgi:uncharacterized protein YbbK (DUF523 family)